MKMKKFVLMAMLLVSLGATSAMAQDPTYTKLDNQTVIYTTLDKESGQNVASEYKVTKDAIILQSMYLVDGASPNKFKMNRDVTKTLKPSIKEKLYETVNITPEKQNIDTRTLNNTDKKTSEKNTTNKHINKNKHVANHKHINKHKVDKHHTYDSHKKAKDNKHKKNK